MNIRKGRRWPQGIGKAARELRLGAPLARVVARYRLRPRDAATVQRAIERRRGQGLGWMLDDRRGEVILEYCLAAVLVVVAASVAIGAAGSSLQTVFVNIASSL